MDRLKAEALGLPAVVNIEFEVLGDINKAFTICEEPVVYKGKDSKKTVKKKAAK